MNAQEIFEDEKKVRAAIREFENAKFNVEHGAPVFRPGFQEIIKNIEPFL
jgi:hypothetical protein